MHPVLIKVGWFTIYSFGFMLAVTFLFAIYISSRRAKRFGVDPQHMLDLSVYVILGAIIGSRLLYVAFHLDEYNSVVDMFALWQGGATFYGGLLLAIFLSYVFTQRKKLDFLLVADIVSPTIALGVGITRIGCFMSGCCYGLPTTHSWGVVFPSESAAGAYARSLAADAGNLVALYPTQLFESFFGFVTFAILMLGGPKLRKRGATLGAYLILYAIARFTVDFFRYYENNMIVGFGLSLNQWVSIGLFITGLFLLTRKTSKKTQPVAA